MKRFQSLLCGGILAALLLGAAAPAGAVRQAQESGQPALTVYPVTRRNSTQRELQLDQAYRAELARGPRELTPGEQELEKVVDDILLECGSDMTDLRKIRTIHDYLVLHTEYDYDNYIQGAVPDSSHTAYGVLTRHKGISSGYQDAFFMLVDRLGIPCVRVNGTAGGGAQAWNMVKLDGSWYHVDCAWDDPVPDRGADSIRYSCFLVSDEKMSEDHNWPRESAPRALNTQFDDCAGGEGEEWADMNSYEMDLLSNQWSGKLEVSAPGTGLLRGVSFSVFPVRQGDARGRKLNAFISGDSDVASVIPLDHEGFRISTIRTGAFELVITLTEGDEELTRLVIPYRVSDHAVSPEEASYFSRSSFYSIFEYIGFNG